jgi:hypothetical protein
MNTLHIFAFFFAHAASYEVGHDLEVRPMGDDAAYVQLTSELQDLAASKVMWTVVCIVIVAMVVYFFLVAPARQHAAGGNMLEHLMVNREGADDIEVRAFDPFEEDTYNLATCLIVRDLHALAAGKALDKGLRYSRLAFSVGLIALTVFLQLAVLIGTKKYVTPQQVASIRDSYEEYEKHMYGEKHTYLNANGKARGMPGFFNASAFDTLTDDQQQAVCNIPLSQLTFISLILLVWALTASAQLKKCVENFMAIVFFAKTTDSMANALECMDSEDDPEFETDDGIDTQVIVGLTLPVKALLILAVFLPDFCTTCYCLWLGSRWLVATNDFGNMISNAVCLEFLLMLKCLLFYALVTERNKRDLDHTGMAPSWNEEPAGYGVYFSTIGWLIIAVVWVYWYIQNQQVLPDYKWDVTVVCSDWLANQLNPNAAQNN